MAKNKRQVSKYAANAAFVFVGKVLKTKAATMARLAADNTVIVQVQRVVSAPDMFTSLAGHQITARFTKPAAIRKGAVLTFFATGWVFGETVAVDILGTAADTASKGTASLVRGAIASGKDNVLRARLSSAKMGVVGRVVDIERSQKRPTHITEHDPNWHKATINVDEVVKGKKGVKKVTVLFPNSDDVRWHAVGKYTHGQQGIWLLQPGQKQDPKGIPPKVMAAIPAGTDVLTTVHPADYLPLHELARVRALLTK